ncbi:uncharacterized protein XM38_047160 [Halomicronema hongdechloris C2206]|uniref:Guanylate cyclase domain-containing protein n=1 Tax=Halomicronema hongdechloris C2206 TaxID=1641165 RepID=A0A1Z3HTW6_9CYAN|nr:TRAFs-binding domain-containing protein [Halomicronema hongdechloris]ASC73744.1 uncharacterized protein XM38_047160 [Halomicronema hongdechloris C2206]
MYQPQPIDTSQATLTAEYLYLAERLAENSHDHWAQALLGLGWRYGTRLNAAERTHPYLCPFEQLPEAVQEQQLQVYLDNLKTAVALGYRIEAQPVAPPRIKLGTAEAATATLRIGAGAMPRQLAPLLALRREIVTLRPRTPDLHCSLGEMMLQLGETLMAYDVLADGLKQWPQHLRLQQLLALALARSGATHAANEVLGQLMAAGQDDDETLSLLARTHKDLWRQAGPDQMRSHHLKLAADRYLEAYRRSGSLWPGINAATLSLLQGNRGQARQLATAVAETARQALEQATKTGQDTYWILATLGEAELVLGRYDQAAAYYTQAVQVGQGRFGDLGSSYRNAALLMQHLGQGLDPLREWFQMPRVIVFCGHRMDAANRPQPRLPPVLEDSVYDAIHTRLQQLNGRVGYASAACGSDILFLEALLELGGECNIVLPYNRDQFIQDSVSTATAGDWVARFDRVLSQAREVVVASDCKPQADDVSYEYSNRLLHGLAKIRAEQLYTDLVPLAVWNGQPGDGPGGTASTVAYWQQWSHQVEIIDSAALLAAAGYDTESEPRSTPTAALEQQQREIRALLFADVVQYTQLLEDQLCIFMRHFLEAVAALSNQPRYQPLTKNTWGDALYYVFPTVQEAGLFALDLGDLMQSIDWQQQGLPADLTIRIALHAGPVLRNVDPITNQVNYMGTHVNHAARIEPITPPGKVYASQAFAAIATSEGQQSFTCSYVGRMPWAKHYGTFPTYHVQRLHS